MIVGITIAALFAVVILLLILLLFYMGLNNGFQRMGPCGNPSATDARQRSAEALFLAEGDISVAKQIIEEGKRREERGEGPEQGFGWLFEMKSRERRGNKEGSEGLEWLDDLLGEDRVATVRRDDQGGFGEEREVEGGGGERE